jgi:hypothetical protein
MWKPLRIENRKGAMGGTERMEKRTSTGCEQVEKAGWTGSDGDRHALVLCDFLPYPVQFANNCHPRSHEVEAAAGTHRDPPRDPTCVLPRSHGCGDRRGRPLHTPALAAARRHDAMARSVQEPIAHENAQAYARRAVIFVRFA